MNYMLENSNAVPAG